MWKRVHALWRGDQLDRGLNTGDPAAFGNTLRSVIHSVDPNQPVEAVQTLDDRRFEALAAPRLTATLLGVFAALARLAKLLGVELFDGSRRRLTRLL